MPPGALAAVAMQNAAPACVPASLASSTIRAAVLIAAGQAAVAGVVPAQVAALVEGVLKTMLLTKLKAATAVLFLSAVVCAGPAAGMLVYQTQAGESVQAQQTSSPPAAKAAPELPDQQDQTKPIPGEVKPELGVPKRIRPGDRLSIHAIGTLPDAPIQGFFRVETSGKVALGPTYGRVEVYNLTLEEAEAAIQHHLRATLKNPVVSVTLVVPGADQEMEHRVRQLEKEVRELRTAVDVLQGKRRE
jgi:hypothetical protein